MVNAQRKDLTMDAATMANSVHWSIHVNVFLAALSLNLKILKQYTMHDQQMELKIMPCLSIFSSICKLMNGIRIWHIIPVKKDHK